MLASRCLLFAYKELGICLESFVRRRLEVPPPLELGPHRREITRPRLF